MSEKIFTAPNSEQLKAIQEKKEEDAWLAQYMEENPDKFIEITVEDRRECGPEIAELEMMFDEFEASYSLEVLNAITTSEEAFNHPIREPANLALNPITAKFNSIKDETNISPEKLKELKIRRKKIVNAVGFLNGGEFDKDIKKKVNGGIIEHNR